MFHSAALLFSSVLATVALESNGECPKESGILTELKALGVSLDSADARMVVTSGKDFVEVTHFDLQGRIRDVRKLKTETTCSTRQKAVAVIVSNWLLALQKTLSVELNQTATPSPPTPAATPQRLSMQLTGGPLWGPSFALEGASASVSLWKKTDSFFLPSLSLSVAGMSPSAMRVTDSLAVRYTRAWLSMSGQMRLHLRHLGASMELGLVGGRFWAPASSAWDVGAQGVFRLYSRHRYVPLYIQASALRWFREQVLVTPLREEALVAVWNVQLGLGVSWTFH